MEPKLRRGRLSPAMVVACAALFVGLSGAGYAVVKLPPNSVGTAQIKNNAVNSAKVKNGTLKTVDFAAGQLPASAQGAAGATGAMGPPGPPGPPGGGLASLEDLEGIPCTIHGTTGEVWLGELAEDAGFGKHITCLHADQFEPNDEAAQATDITGDFFMTAVATIYPGGDDDWFKILDKDLTHLCVLAPSNANVDIQAFADGAPLELGPSGCLGNPELPEGAHDWTIHVTGAGVAEYSVDAGSF
jgi:hypothetical protein